MRHGILRNSMLNALGNLEDVVRCSRKKMGYEESSRNWIVTLARLEPACAVEMKFHAPTCVKATMRYLY